MQTKVLLVNNIIPMMTFRASQMTWQKNLPVPGKTEREHFPWIRKTLWRRKWAVHSSILCLENPMTEESGGLQLTGLHKVRHNSVTEHACNDTFIF